MSTHKYFDKICVFVIAFALLITVLFMNGEAYGVEMIVDEDAEVHSDQQYFTANDTRSEYDLTDATEITLNGSSASVSGKGAYAYDGGVVIANAGVYILSGTIDDGTITVDADGSAKIWIYLNGVNVTCKDSAAMLVENADKVFLTLAEGQTNVFTSGSEYETSATETGIDGVIFSRDDLTINGEGSLTVAGGPAHGIVANDDMVVTGGTIQVTSAGDAVHVNDSLRITSCSMTLEAGDDAIAVDNEGGYIYIESGDFNISAADEGIAAEGDITIDGGEFEISVGTDQGCHGIKSGGTVTVNNGTIDISSCYEGIQAFYIDVTGGDITINSLDDGLNASNGTDSFGMGFGAGGSGMRQREADEVSGTETGTSDEVTEGERPEMGEMPEGEAPESGEMPEGERPEFGEMPEGERPEMSEMPEGERPELGEMPEEVSDSTNEAAEKTEADTETSWIHINGGNLTILNESGRDADGIDSNGDIIISGGLIRVSLTGSGGNCALDYASENGGVLAISGGSVIACGSSQMAEGFDASSTQCSIMYNLQTEAEAGSTLTICDSSGNVLMSYEVPYSFTSANISCPEMKLGETYTITVGETEETVTLDETSVTCGAAGSSMFGGMNQDGTQQSNFGRKGGHGGPGGRNFSQGTSPEEDVSQGTVNESE